MAPFKKHKRQPTILNFFTPSSSLPVKKVKTESKSVKRAPLPQEVIIIDSDEDDICVPLKRKVPDEFSEIEIVEDEPENPSVASCSLQSRPSGEESIGAMAGPSRSNENVDSPGISRGDEENLTLKSVLQADKYVPPGETPLRRDNPTSIFGVPSHLLRPVSPPNPDSLSSMPPPKAEDSLPDKKLPLFLPDREGSLCQPYMDVDLGEIEPSISEEWGTGDDEAAATNSFSLDDDDEILDMKLIHASDIPPHKNTKVSTCPICELQLHDMSEEDIQNHVNQCIDSRSHSPLVSSTSVLQPSMPSNFPHPTSTPESSLNTTAFSVLMTSHKENEAWKEATAVEDHSFRLTKQNGGRRKAPFYKVLQGMPIAVDAFRYGTIPSVTAYFLTHAHSDHYTNLSSNWKSGPIYCSESTANLIIHMLSVDRKWVHPLPMDVTTVVPNTGGVRVTLIEANHCPGSCLFLFEGQQTVNAGDSTFASHFVGSSREFRYLHCGDFRASPQHVLHPAVKGKRIDHVYLDTTYLDSKYTFPPQPLVISACAELAKRLVLPELNGPISVVSNNAKTKSGWFSRAKPQEKKEQGRVLVVVGTYSIGKERIVKAVARALNTKIYCDARKAAILRCQSDPDLHALLTSNPLEAGVHLVPLGMITSDKLKGYIDRFKGPFSRVVGFRPTGWTYSPSAGADTIPSIPSILAQPSHKTFTHAHLQPTRNSTPALRLYGVPYSEHSSFFELTCFALSFEWQRMIATVNVGSERSRAKMGKWVEKWEAERKKRGNTIVPYRELNYW